MTVPPDDILDLLAAYALDAVEPEEIARIQALLDEQPDLRATLAELRATANQLPYALPEAAPSPSLRQRVLDHAIGRTRRPPFGASRPGRVRGWLLALGGAAAVAVVAAAIAWAQLGGAQAELARMQEQVARARAETGAAQATAQAAQQVIAQLQGTGHGTMLRTNTGETVLVVQLPLPRPGRTYQLWRIQGNKAPASAGLLTVNQQGYGSIVMAPGQQPQSGEVVAVTDEPGGGSAAPTTKPLISGEVQAS
jgi:anti-sigma-K factor RskA